MDRVDLAGAAEGVGAAFAQAEIFNFAGAAGVRYGWVRLTPDSHDEFFHGGNNILDRSFAAEPVAATHSLDWIISAISVTRTSTTNQCDPSEASGDSAQQPGGYTRAHSGCHAHRPGQHGYRTW